jgi:hypothetical protein
MKTYAVLSFEILVFICKTALQIFYDRDPSIQIPIHHKHIILPLDATKQARQFVNFFIYELSNEFFSSSVHIAPNGGMINE